MGRKDTEPESAASVHLTLAGAATLRGPAGTRVALGPRDAALLAWLAIEGPTPRARLAGLVWPEHELDAARNNLRQRLFKLRRLAGAEVIAGSTTLRLAPEVEHDLDDAEGLLADVPDEVGGEFSIWLAQQRERRRERVRHALVELVEMAEDAKDFADALVHAKELLALEPLSEDAHRRVIRLHYLNGDRAAALMAFDRCEQVLKDEVGTRPSGDTRSLLDLINRQADGSTDGSVAIAARTAALLRPPLRIGREEAWHRLEQTFVGGRLAIVVGVAGMGKSRLLADFARDKGDFMVAGARPGDERVPYASLARVLRHLPRACLDALDESTRRELARLMPELGEAVPMPQAGELARFHGALASALRSSPLQGVIVDDLHFADDASVQALQAIAHDSPLCWLFGARPNEGSAMVCDWIDKVRSSSESPIVTLSALDLPDLTELLRTLGRGVAPEMAAMLLRQTAGNPLFVLETLRAQDDLAASDRRGGWPVAPTQLALIARRITSLSTPAVALARCAAIAMPDFSIDLACEVLGVRTLALADPIAELESAQVLVNGAFVHDLVLEAALQSVPAPVAQQLHAQIADFIGRQGAEPARLAAHWEKAQRWRLAAQAYRQAISKAGGAGQRLICAALLDDAARCWERAGDKSACFDALYERAEILLDVDRGSQTDEAVRRLEAAAERPSDRLRSLAARLILSSMRSGGVPALLSQAPQAIELARERGERETEVKLTLKYCNALVDSQRASEALDLLERHRDWVDGRAPYHIRWDFWHEMAMTLQTLSRLRDAASAWEACRHLASQGDRPDHLARSLTNAAWTEAKVGRLPRAIALFDEARAMMSDGDQVGVVYRLETQSAYAHLLRDRGRYAEAIRLLQECLDVFEAQGASTVSIASAEVRLGLVYMHLGQASRAVPLLKTERPEIGDHLHLLRQVLLVCATSLPPTSVRARIRSAVQEMPDPEDPFRRLFELFEARYSPPAEAEHIAAGVAAWAAVRERYSMALPAYAVAANAAWARGEPEHARSHVESMFHLARDYQGDAQYPAEIWLAGARILDALGQSERMFDVLSTGLEWVRRVHDEHVPEPFRESFLHRNPINRELLALAARHGMR